MTAAENREPARKNRGPVAGPANRRAILAAAREVFAEGGYNAPLSSIAKRAGVGQGSLYRHFPDRVALVAAVFDENLIVVEDEVAAADDSLDRLLEVIAAQATVSARLIEVLWIHADDDRVGPLTDRLHRICAGVLAAEQAAGRAAHDRDVDDILIAITMLAGALSQAPPDGAEEVARRSQTMLKAGLRRAATPA